MTMRRLRGLLAVTLLGTLLVGCTSDDSASSDTRSQRAGAQDAGTVARIPDIVEDVRPSVVAVITDGGEGSGVVWDDDGTIVTNHHVVANASEIRVAFADGQRTPARLLHADPSVDIAVLETERTGLPPAEFASDVPEVGELAVAIGNPLGFQGSVTAGIISGLHRVVPGSTRTTLALVDLIQTDAPISPGNSGGALVNDRSQVVGINVAFIPPQASAVAIGFAIPAPTVVDTVEELLRTGEASHAFIGIRALPVTPAIAERFNLGVEQGLIVTEVASGTPAARAGIREGDVLLRLDDRELSTLGDLFAVLRRHDPGDRLSAVVLRGGERRTVAIELSDRPE